MSEFSSRILVSAFVLPFILCSALPNSKAGEIPAETQAALKQYNLDPSFLSNLGDDLNVPADWIEKAKKEPPARIKGTWDPREFDKLVSVFKARYPGVNVAYARSDRFNRSVSPLVAVQEGKYIADVIVNVNKLTYFDFKKANALADLRPMPTFNKLGEGMRGEDGLWVGSKITRRCLGYNTDKVTSASDLPQQWDDLLTMPRWGNGHLAVVNAFSVWLVPLWQAKGEEWARNFLYRLRDNVHAQIRKEGENAALGLVAAGEYDGIIVASEYRTKERQNKGAPLAFYCPGLVPTNVSSLIVMKNSPSKDAALIFTNWSISLEGQLLSLAISGQSPVRPEFQGAKFDYYPDQIEGKTTAFESDLQSDQANAEALWSEVWGLGK